jgi:hypothetical protein
MQLSLITHPFQLITLLRFLVRARSAALVTELLELKTVRRLLLVLGRHVVAILALGALQRDVISRHNSLSFKRA